MTDKKKKSLWSDLPRRIATISIGFPTLLFAVSNPLSASFFCLLVHCIAVWEWLSMFQKRDNTNNGKTTTIQVQHRIIWVLISMGLSTITDHILFSFSISLVVGLLILYTVCNENSNKNYKYLQQQSMHIILGLVILTIPLQSWYIVSQDFVSAVSLLLIAWNCDSGALIFGRLSSLMVHQRYRIPLPLWVSRVSPAKSTEGFLGGIFLGTLTSYYLPQIWSFCITIASNFIQLDNNVASIEYITTELLPIVYSTSNQRFYMGIIFSILAILGDLIESAMKRQCDVKDSGKLFPGHGGVLDKLDSSLLTILFFQFAMARSNHYFVAA